MEPGSGHLYLLPYDQFVFAELESVEGEQRLRVVFATHELEVTGQALRRIVLALQRGELGHLTLLPEELRDGVPVGQPLIQTLEVRAVESTTNAQEPSADALPAL
ncbi:MAG: hypothetical protein IT580_16700 [Verrucomicrobiales bacterium]|nr:hypothetical protein [Verrucomicrobiales bacterium]